MLVGKTKREVTHKNTGTLILGIGNPILRDDRVGHLLVQELGRYISSPEIELKETSLAGLDLAELLSGFDSAIIIDAIQTDGTPGEIYCLHPDDFQIEKSGRYNQHSTGLLQALELGRALGWPMPEKVTIVAVEAGDVCSFGDELTPAVARAVPVALQTILDLLGSPGK